jgi:TolB-like protein/Flp pilus assembly protein TadD
MRDNERQMNASTKAVFLSYASQDAAAARRICDSLRAAGIEVWFDESELRGGDAWDASIRKQIKECALFIPVISASSNARSEGYFRLEWRLAVERSHLMADDQPFLLPVLIDDMPEVSARVPDRFRERQWSRAAGGMTTIAFVEQVSRLLAGVAAPAAVDTLAGRVPTASRKRHQFLTGAMLATVAVVGVVAAILWTGRKTELAPAASRKSIAVMPFDNLSGHPEDGYLADGLQEEILNALARLRELNVISRTSVMEFRGKARNVREIGQRLDVGSVLEGSIRREGDTLRLTIQLIDVHDDRHILATNYDRALSHILDLQSAVARQVADALAATLTQYERGELERVATNSGDAYDRYLRAVAAFRKQVPTDNTGLVEPRRLLEEAVRLDPDYADALVLLSQADTLTFENTQRPEDAVRAKQAFERALAVDAQLPEAQLARGIYEMYISQDVAQAVVDLKAVLRLRPNSSKAHAMLGFALRRRGHVTEALDHFVRAWDLDPLNTAYEGSPISTLLGLRRFPEAIEWTKLLAKRFPDDPDRYISRARLDSYLQHSVEPLRELLRMHGNLIDPVSRHVIEAGIARGEGRYLDEIKVWDKVPIEAPASRALLIGFLFWGAGDAGHAEQSFRNVEREARKIIESEPTQTDALAQLALSQSMLGEHAQALASIDAARTIVPEERDATNGPHLSFIRSIILVRAGRSAEGYAEVKRLLHVPFSGRQEYFEEADPELLVVEHDPHYDEIVNHPPRL